MRPFGGNDLVMRLVLGAWLAIFACPGLIEAQEAVYPVDEVKAAFLYHFGTYVQWPPPQSPPDRPMTIAVLGSPTVAAQLERFLPGRLIQGRPVGVRQLTQISDLQDDELLYIGSERNARLAELIETVGQRPILIVTDSQNGLAQGAMINFQIVDERLRFEISLPAAQSAGLMLSSRLLSAALRVETADCWYSCSYRYEPRIPQLALRHGPTAHLLSRRG